MLFTSQEKKKKTNKPQCRINISNKAGAFQMQLLD